MGGGRGATQNCFVFVIVIAGVFINTFIDLWGENLTILNILLSF